MTDKNNIEIKTGDIVEITDAFFKTDNGLYFVTASPDDPSWSGRDHCLKKISRKGKISTAKYNICFWPIGVFVSDRAKAAEARRWNKEHAQIEVKSVSDMAEVKAYFQARVKDCEAAIRRETWDFGEDAECVQKDKTFLAHYEAVIRRIEGATA